MKVKSKSELRQALARIMEKVRAAKPDAEQKVYDEVLQIAYEALGKPSLAFMAAYLAGKEPPDKPRDRRKSKEVGR